MNILIIGGGLIGVSSAYFLQKAGHQVKVIERQSDVALETSFANGGQISVSYSEPWSNVANLKKMLKWMKMPTSPLLFKPKLNWQQISWGLQFLNECRPSRNEANIKKMMEIALYSRNTLDSLRLEHNLQYNQQTNGILTFYRTEETFKDGKKASELMTKFGVERTAKSLEESYAIEPALLKNNFTFAGSDYTPSDQSGNAYVYCQEMKKLAMELGVVFVFNTELEEFTFDNNDTITHVTLKQEGDKRIRVNGFDSVVIAAGSYTYPLALKAGVRLPIYPTKGYSASIKIKPGREEFINNVSLTDSDNKIVFTRLGDELRIAGTAEFNGYDLELNTARCEFLKDRAAELFPDSLDLDSVKYWTGLRSSTPGNVPIIGKTSVKNMYINSGHGTLGWTMAAGSGRMIQQVIDNQPLLQAN